MMNIIGDVIGSEAKDPAGFGQHHQIGFFASLRMTMQALRTTMHGLRMTVQGAKGAPGRV
jgi:hypothetical protein